MDLTLLSYDAPRTCTKCKRKDAIPAGDARLSCPLCREKAKEWQRNYYYRVKERNSAAKKFENERVGAGTATTSTTTIKPLKRKRKPSTVEYQAADKLYKALCTTLQDATSSAASAYHMPSFRGCFSIVTDPSVNHLDRARAVMKDLKKTVKYPFVNVYRDKAFDNSNTFARITADCRCLTLVNMAGSSSSRPVLNSGKGAAAPPLGASSHYLNGGTSSSPVANGNGNGHKLVEALEASFERNCGGKVKIIVKGDFSHPLGISGQKVTIKVVH